MLFRVLYNNSVVWVYSVKNEKYIVSFYIFYKNTWLWVDSLETVPYTSENDGR